MTSVLGINFGSSYASIAIIGKEGHAECIANEEGERQIACAISYNGEEVVSPSRRGRRSLLAPSSSSVTAAPALVGLLALGCRAWGLAGWP